VSTEVGRKHVDWLMQANVPNFTGERYRRIFQNGVDAIEAETRRTVLTELRAEVGELTTPDDEAHSDSMAWTTDEFWVDGEAYVRLAAVLAAIDRALEATEEKP
jgi:hypothetical protein